VRIDHQTILHDTALAVIPPTRAHQATHHQPPFFSKITRPPLPRLSHQDRVMRLALSMRRHHALYEH
jgi:hypothetical protein